MSRAFLSVVPPARLIEVRRIRFLPLALLAGCSLLLPAPAEPAPESRPVAETTLADVVYVGVASSAAELAQASVGAVRPDGSFREVELAVQHTAVAREAGAAFAVRVRDDGRATIERLDLRTGAIGLRVDVAAVPPPPPSPYARATPFAVSPDGRTVVLGRHTEDGTTVRFDAFDGASGAALGTVVLEAQDASHAYATLDVPLRDRVVARLVGSRDGRGTGVEWVALDRELRVLRRVTGEAIPKELSWPTSCWQPLRELPGGELVTLCGDVFVRWLQFLERATLAATARVDLPSSIEFAGTIGWHVGADGVVTVLTERPALIRVDAARRRLIDAREVPTEKSLLDLFRPQVALAKIYVHPNLQFSADGRRAFVAPMAADIPHHWRRGVVAIDVPSATIAWRALSGDDVRGIHLSPDGERLYVLVSEQKEALAPEARLLVLDASSGAVLGQTETLPRPAFQIVTVARP